MTKTRIVFLGIAALALSLTSGVAPMETAEARGPLNRVVGSGFVDLTDDIGLAIYFQCSVAAFQDASGNVWGHWETQLDLPEFGIGPVRMGGVITCADFDGIEVWLMGKVTHTTDPDFIPLGSDMLMEVKDFGGEGEDQMHQEAGFFFPPEITCADRIPLFPSIVDSGNFQVR